MQIYCKTKREYMQQEMTGATVIAIDTVANMSISTGWFVVEG
jgi:hypothetical protein